MFKQFTENVSGTQVYLLFSLAIFLVFFIVVTIVLIRLKKNHVDHMSDLPLHDSHGESFNTYTP
jgi:cbb3-type cytochrome oxidase subunit 3